MPDVWARYRFGSEGRRRGSLLIQDHLQSPHNGAILNRMVQYSSSRLDASFSALSDATRRGVLEQLGRADASITDLADKFHMSLTGMKKHVGVLEQAGLVATEKVGRVRTCKLGPRRLEEAAAWIERYREIFEQHYQRLDALLEELQATPSQRTRPNAQLR